MGEGMSVKAVPTPEAANSGFFQISHLVNRINALSNTRSVSYIPQSVGFHDQITRRYRVCMSHLS